MADAASYPAPTYHTQIDLMNMKLLKITALSLLIGMMAFAPTQGYSQEKKKANATQKSGAPDDGKKKRTGMPARGKIDAIDKIAKTVKVGERVFSITSETRIRKANQPATLDDAKVGDEVGISYQEADGKLTALSLRLGPAPQGDGKGKKKKKE